MKKKGAMVWLARDVDVNMLESYEMYSKKPIQHKGYFTGDWVETFCRKKFERITGFKLKPGECKRVRIKIEVAK